jgi:Putative Ig domain
VMGGTKGSLPPGHSIVPNLLMHAVALREGRSDAASYLTAARNQAQWIVTNLDPANPLVTKGQRMSEHILVPALAEFAMRDPSGPVTGVDTWLAAWADTVIARSNNYWDFRKYSDTIWTPENPGSSSHPWWNEPGNIAGFPASALAAVTRLTDPGKIARLRAIAVSQTDQVFGRNPHNRHFSFRATQAGYGFEGVETGWFSQHLGGLGILENARGVLDSSAKQPSFPYNPNVSPGYVEGWVAFNSAWNAAMVWSARDRSSIRFLAPDPLGAVGVDGAIQIELTAPLNFNRSLAESAVVRLTSADGDVEALTLTETGADTAVFQGLLSFENTATPSSGNGILQAVAGGDLTTSYAYDIYTRSASATAADTSEAGLAISTNALPVARVGTAYGPFTLDAINANPPLTWQITVGSLPDGMELLADGTLQGTPTESGVFPLTLRAQDAESNTEKAFTLSSSALAITTSGLPAASSGVPYSQVLQSIGGLGAVTWSLSGSSSLPAGFTLDPVGTISGTSFAAGEFTIDLTATDDAGVSESASYTLTVFGTSSGVRFTDTFESGSGSWFKAAPNAGDSLAVVNGQMEWKETGSLMAEVIGRSFPTVALSVGQKLRVSFDYRQNGSTTNNIVRAGLYHFATPVAADNWAGANAIGAWKGYGTFVRDNSTSTHVARAENGGSTSATSGPNNGSSGTYTDIGTKTTQFNLNDNGTVSYQVVFEANYLSSTRMDTLLTISSTSGGTTNTHFSIPGSQTTGTIHSSFNTVVFKQAGGSGMPTYYDNITLDLIGGTNPAWFSDWQDITWPGKTDEAIIGPSADPDSDSLPNHLEWALHLAPNQSSPFVPAMAFDGDFMLYTYTRRKIAPGQSTFHVEWSDSLTEGAWSEIDVAPSPPVAIDATRESVTCSIPLGPENRRFIRLRIQSQTTF